VVRIQVTALTPIDGAPENFASVAAFLIPAADPRVRIAWQYVVQDGKVLHPCGVKIEPAPTTSVHEWAHVGGTLVRDLPLARLERAARIAVEHGLREDGGPPSPSLGSPPSPDEIPELAREMVRERHPDLDPDSGPAAARRWKRLMRLAEVVHEQQVAQVAGEKSPTAVIAKARGVAPATVRGWLHQASLEGFTPAPYTMGLDVFAEIADADPVGDLGAEG
jgi:hypothetical protein